MSTGHASGMQWEVFQSRPAVGLRPARYAVRINGELLLTKGGQRGLKRCRTFKNELSAETTARRECNRRALRALEGETEHG